MKFLRYAFTFTLFMITLVGCKSVYRTIDKKSDLQPNESILIGFVEIEDENKPFEIEVDHNTKIINAFNRDQKLDKFHCKYFDEKNSLSYILPEGTYLLVVDSLYSLNKFSIGAFDSSDNNPFANFSGKNYQKVIFSINIPPGHLIDLGSIYIKFEYISGQFTNTHDPFQSIKKYKTYNYNFHYNIKVRYSVNSLSLDSFEFCYPNISHQFEDNILNGLLLINKN